MAGITKNKPAKRSAMEPESGAPNSFMDKESGMTDAFSHIRILRQNLPEHPIDAIAKLEEVSQLIRKSVAEEIAGVLGHYQSHRVGDLTEKRETAKRLNDLLDGLGLRIKCPKTARGAVLVGVPNWDSKGDGRFQFQIAGESPRSTYAASFPKIELMLRDMREKPRGFKSRLSPPDGEETGRTR